MDNLAGPRKRLEAPESPPKLKLTVSESLEDLPIAGVWSRGPVYQPLDPDFLAQPRIPKAPPTPRLQIDRINGSLRVIDALDQRAKLTGLEANQRIRDLETSPHASTLPHKRRRTLAQFTRERRYQLMALVIGFSAGVAVAMLLHFF